MTEIGVQTLGAGWQRDAEVLFPGEDGQRHCWEPCVSHTRNKHSILGQARRGCTGCQHPGVLVRVCVHSGGQGCDKRTDTSTQCFSTRELAPSTEVQGSSSVQRRRTRTQAEGGVPSLTWGFLGRLGVAPPITRRRKRAYRRVGVKFSGLGVTHTFSYSRPTHRQSCDHTELRGSLGKGLYLGVQEEKGNRLCRIVLFATTPKAGKSHKAMHINFRQIK